MYTKTNAENPDSEEKKRSYITPDKKPTNIPSFLPLKKPNSTGSIQAD